MDSREWDGIERRKSEREELVKAVVCAIRDESLIGGVPPAEHAEQHAFLHEWIEEIKAKRARRERIKTNVIGGAILLILGSVGTLATNAFTYMREHLK